MFGDDEPDEQQPVASSASAAFLRAVADKKRAFVGEQVTVDLVPLRRQSRRATSSRSRSRKSDGFWSEEIPSTNPQGRLAFTDQVEGGQHYQVAVVLQRALFPLAPGKLTVTPMEAEVAHADFFGRARSTPRRLKSEPLAIEARRAAAQGRRSPRDFPAGQRRAATRSTSRSIARGGGRRRGDADHDGARDRERPQRRAAGAADVAGLEGVRAEDERRRSSPVATVQGSKTTEWLIRPERPGKTTIPALTFASFDPAAKRYVETQSQPIEMVVSGEPTGHGDRPADGGGRNAGGRRRERHRRGDPADPRARDARRGRSARRSCAAPGSRSRW